MTPQDLPDSAQDAPAPVPTCPKCEGEMWDNREGKRNPKAPDFKCKDRGCDGVIWPPRTASAGGAAAVMPAAAGMAVGGGGGGPAATATTAEPATGAAPNCPICGGPMWDDRASKRNPKAPDFKCKNKPKVRGGPGCEGVIWPPRDGARSSASGTATTPRPKSSAPSASHGAPPPYDGPPPDDDDLLPF